MGTETALGFKNGMASTQLANAVNAANRKNRNMMDLLGCFKENFGACCKQWTGYLSGLEEFLSNA